MVTATWGGRDYDPIPRLWSAGHRPANAPEVLLHWREAESRREPIRGSRPSHFALKRSTTCAARTWWANGVVVWGAGPWGRRSREALAQDETVRAFVDIDPRKIGQTIHGAPVVPPEALNRFDGAFVVAAVGQRGAREYIRAALEGMGWRDWCAVA